MDIQNKLKLFFCKLVEPGYVLNNYYSDSLVSKLQNPDEDAKNYKNSPLLAELILDTLLHAEHANFPVQIFLIRSLAVILRNELQYSKIITKHEDTILEAFKGILQSNAPPGLKVALVELATSLASHNSGVCWLVKTKIWEYVFILSYEQQTVFVLRQIYKFTSDFLWKLNDFADETSLKSVLDFILEPIINNPYEKVKSIEKEDEVNLTRKLEQSLHMMLATLNNNHKIYESPLLIKLLVKNYNIIYHSMAIFAITHREDVMQYLSKLMFLIGLAKVFIDKPMSQSQFIPEMFIDLTVFYFNTVQHYLKRRLVLPVLDYCNNCYLIWVQAWSSKKSPTITRYGKEFDIQNQLIVIPLVPLLAYIKNRNWQEANCVEPLNDYMMKVLNVSCEHTIRAGYRLRDLMMDGDSLSIALQSIKRLSCLRNHLSDEQANIVFQAMFYLLKDYIPGGCTTVKDEEDDDGSNKMLVMTYVMDTILMLVKNYNINWNDSIEVLCLYNVVFLVLQRKNLSCKFIVTALNLITLTIKKFLPPNLSLLLEAQPDSTVNNIGELIYSNMHDINWEIKDSALEMLLVCTEISFIKYTPFQKQIIDNNLIVVAATISLNESEFYVQASALKCLSAATKIQSIWEHLLQTHSNIQDHLISILANNPEGIVRKEATNVLSEIYQNLKLTPAFKKTLYEHMVSAAIADFHWEVQVSALKFWKVVIQNLFTNQGMLDGTFPPVTFSKESRKIITLNQSEIHKILVRILDELANNGCLTVLVKLMQDTDAEIVDNAYQVSSELHAILVKYNVCDIIRSKGINASLTDEYTNIKETVKEVTDSVETMNEAVNVKSENVIEGILNSDDISLLSNIYQRRMRLQSAHGNELNMEPKIKLQKYASPLAFIKIMNDKDFKLIIEEKHRWKDGIRSLESLLDDILGLYQPSCDINTLDCY